MSISGPQFLGFYGALAILANWWLRQHYYNRERVARVPALDFSSDPYQIAFLRKGEAEAVDMAIFALVDRGLLEEADGLVRASRPDARDLVRRPIEQAVLDRFMDWGRPEEAREDPAVRRACDAYRENLVGHGLLAGEDTYRTRRSAFRAALALTLGIAGLRIINALLQGRHNIGFQILFSLACALFLALAYRKRLTGLGEESLLRLHRLFAGLRRRAKQVVPGGASHDAAVLAALFGFQLLPASQFPFLQRLFRKPNGSGGSGDGGDGGGSCDGGGCGGGGCGGGCGG